MLPVSEFSLPFPAAALQLRLGLAAPPLLRLVELTALQAEVESGRLDPAGFLSPAEQATLAGFTFPKRRMEWLGGRLAAKAAALAWEGQPLAAVGLAGWQVVSAPDGRPGLQSLPPRGPELELSISHSHGLAASLLVVARPCGLDLEKVTGTMLRVRERFCSATEAALLQRELGPETREEVRLTLLWTAKEALRKGRGGVPLTGFLAMRLVGLELLGGQGWCFRLAVAGAGEYPVVVFLAGDFACAVCVV